MAFDISALVNVFKRNPIRLALGLGLGLVSTIAIIFSNDRLYGDIWNPWAGPIVLLIGAVLGVGILSIAHEVWVRVWRQVLKASSGIQSAIHPWAIRRQLTNLDDEERTLLREMLEGCDSPPYSTEARRRYLLIRLCKKGITRGSYQNDAFYAVSDIAWNVISEHPEVLDMHWGWSRYNERKLRRNRA